MSRLHYSICTYDSSLVSHIGTTHIFFESSRDRDSLSLFLFLSTCDGWMNRRRHTLEETSTGKKKKKKIEERKKDRNWGWNRDDCASRRSIENEREPDGNCPGEEEERGRWGNRRWSIGDGRREAREYEKRLWRLYVELRFPLRFVKQETASGEELRRPCRKRSRLTSYSPAGRAISSIDPFRGEETCAYTTPTPAFPALNVALSISPLPPSSSSGHPSLAMASKRGRETPRPVVDFNRGYRFERIRPSVNFLRRGKEVWDQAQLVLPFGIFIRIWISLGKYIYIYAIASIEFLDLLFMNKRVEQFFYRQ